MEALSTPNQDGAVTNQLKRYIDSIRPKSKDKPRTRFNVSTRHFGFVFNISKDYEVLNTSSVYDIDDCHLVPLSISASVMGKMIKDL